MKKAEFKFVYRVVDGAVEIAGDSVLVELNPDQVRTLVDGYKREGCEDILDYEADELFDTVITPAIEKDAQEKYGQKVKGELNAFCDLRFDLPTVITELEAWLK